MTHEYLDPRAHTPLSDAMTMQEFINFGVENIAYVKQVEGMDIRLYTLYSADGEQLAEADDSAYLEALAIQNDLEPVLVN